VRQKPIASRHATKHLKNRHKPKNKHLQNHTKLNNTDTTKMAGDAQQFFATFLPVSRDYDRNNDLKDNQV
jgi:hypothetical protein